MIDRKFLDDKENFKDEMELTFGDMKVRLGDLRQYDSEQRTNLEKYTQRAGLLEGEYGKLANQYNELRALYDQVAQQLQENANGRNSNSPNVVDQLVERLTAGKNPTVLDKPGEFFAPVIEKLRRIDELEAQNKKFQEDLRKELTGAFGFQVSKDMKRDYRSFQWPKEWTFQKVIEFAKERGALEPGSQYPDFDRIHEAVTAPINAAAEREEMVKKARDEGYAAARKELTADGAYVPGPGFGGGMGSQQLKSKFGGIEKIPDEVILNDAEIWSQVVQ